MTCHLQSWLRELLKFNLIEAGHLVADSFNSMFAVRIETPNKFTNIDETLKLTDFPKFLGAIWNPTLMMAPLLSLKHAYAIQQISWKSVKSIKIIYYLWDGANYLKYSCSVSTRLQQVLIGVLQLVFHIRRTGGSSKMHHHRSPLGCKCCITWDLLNKPSSFIPLIASLSYLVAIKMWCKRLGAPTSKLAGAAHSSSETRPPFN